jgi:ribosomal protein S7
MIPSPTAYTPLPVFTTNSFIINYIINQGKKKVSEQILWLATHTLLSTLHKNAPRQNFFEAFANGAQ